MTNQQSETIISSELQQALNEEKLILLSTVEKETNSPNVSAISWVKCMNDHEVRFAVSSDSRIVSNIKNNSSISITVIALETVYTLIGQAKIVEEQMEGVNLKLAKIQVNISAAFESMFWGAKIEQEPRYVKTYNLEKAKKLDEDVYEALVK